MTHPEEGSGSEGISWLDVAASAAGVYDRMKAIGRGANDAFKSGFKEGGPVVGGSDIGATLEAAYGDLGTRSGRQFISNVSSAIKSGSGEASSALEGLKRAQDELTKANQHATEVWQEWKRATDEKADLGVLIGLKHQYADATKAQTDAVQAHTKAQKDLSDAVGESSGSLEHLGGIAQGAIGGAVVAGVQLATEAFGDMLEATEKVADGIFKIGENWEEVNRQLIATTTASGPALAALKDTIGDVSASTAQSFGNITADVATLSTRSGLVGEPLKKVATDLAQAGDIFGKAVDPAKFAAAAAGLNVPADQWDGFLTNLVNLSRATAVPLNELVENLQKNGAALTAFGIGADQSARLLAAMTAGGINSQTAMRGLAAVVTDAHKTHQTFADDLKAIVKGMEDAHKAGDTAAEDRWAEKLGRGAPEFKTAIDDGVLSVESLSGALGDIPTDSIADLHEQTETLSDRMTELGHRMNTALEPLGETLSSHLGGALDKVSEWVSEHGAEITDWVKTFGDGMIWIGGQIGAAFGDLADAAGGIEEAYGVITGNDATKQAGEHLSDLGRKMSDAAQNTDGLTKSFNDLMDAAAKTITISSGLKDAVKLGPDGKGLQLTDSKNLQEDLDKLRQAGVGISQGPGGQLVFQADTPENQKRVQDFLDGIGAKGVPINLVPQIAPPPGTPPGAPGAPGAPGRASTSGTGSSGTQDNFDGVTVLPNGPLGDNGWLRNLFKDIFTPDNSLLTPPAWEVPGGLPGSTFTPTAGADTAPFNPGPRAPGAPAPSSSSGGWDVPANVSLPPAPPKPIGDVLSAAGIPSGNQTPTGVKLPTGLDMHKAPDITPNDLFGNAGVIPKYQGDVPGASPGVVLPTGLGMHDAPTISLADLMEAAGIDSAQQGPDGIVLPVSFSTPTGAPGAGGAPGAVPSIGAGGIGSSPFAGGGGAPGWLGPALQAAGLSADEVKGVLALNAVEGGNTDPRSLLGFTEGEKSAAGPANGPQGHLNAFLSQWNSDRTRGFYQDGRPPGIDAAGNMTNADDYMTFIRNMVGQGGVSSDWQGNKQPSAAEYQRRLMAALGQVPGSGAGSPAGAPGAAPGGTGDGSYAGIGASDNSGTSSPQHGGIPGAPSGVGTPVLAYMKQVMDSFNQQTGSHLSVTADFPGGPTGHGDDGGDHSVKRALDIAGSQAEMDEFAQMIASSPELLAATRQLIHNDPSNPSIGTNDNIIGGHTTSGAQTYSSVWAAHQNHDHWALQYAPGAATNATQTAAYTGGDQVTLADYTQPDPNNPAPTTPPPASNTTPPASPPPTGVTPSAPGAPNAVTINGQPYQYSWDLPPDQSSVLTTDQKTKRDEWISKQQNLLDQQQRSQSDIDDLTKRLADGGDLAQKKSDADAAGSDPNATPDDKSAMVAADREYTEAQKRLADLKQQQYRDQVQQNLDNERTQAQEDKPGKESESDKDKEKISSDFGKGFIGGIMEELGFGSVFGKDPSKWGLTKLLTGGLGYGLGLMERVADKNGGGGAGDSSSDGGGGDSSSGGGDGGGNDPGAAGFIEGIFPGLKKILHPATHGSAPTTPADAGGAPPPASNTPAAAGSSTPVVLASAVTPSTTTNNSLNVQVNHSGFNPTPQVKDQVQQIAATTSAPAMSGGGGQLI